MSVPKIVLYHGTTYDFTEIDVRRGKPFKDFGQGFYATQNRESAVNMALRNRDIEVRRLKRRGIFFSVRNVPQVCFCLLGGVGYNENRK